jgi:hypothetical protein
MASTWPGACAAAGGPLVPVRNRDRDQRSIRNKIVFSVLEFLYYLYFSISLFLYYLIFSILISHIKLDTYSSQSISQINYKYL